MARMLELIRDGAAPASMVRRAARGELSLPANEAIEILVALAADRELGREAEQTLENWEGTSLAEVASDPATPAEVLLHLLRNQRQRPEIIAALCGNSAVAMEELEAMAAHGTAERLWAMMQSARVRACCHLLELVIENPASEPARPRLSQWLAIAQTNEVEEVAADFLVRHAEELERVDAQPFELSQGLEGEEDPLEELLTKAKQGEAVAEPEQKVLSLLQRIGRMRVGERIKLAVRGNREERMVLIRDRSKLVSLAVLESPKVNDSEMENFAAMKNIQETVLRSIATKRKNIKNYGVVRALVNNPKVPLDASLPLLSHLLVKDLRGLAMNKNVNETVRKLAIKMFRMKTERKKD
jgi:hypothetical protein